VKLERGTPVQHKFRPGVLIQVYVGEGREVSI
jgi:hypothetical protein